MTEFLNCPIPFHTGFSAQEKIVMAHGGGGRTMQKLIQELFAKEFTNEFLSNEHDSAQLPMPSGRIAFTTDSYVVNPLFFPGGDIGRLAVFGTVNDLAMSGARPQYLSAGFILEEGFSIESLIKVVRSMKIAADLSGVKKVTGDTKVVEKGKGDGVYINTAGVGVIEHSLKIEPSSVCVGDRVLISGDLGRHGIAIMAARSGLQFETTIRSDCAPLSPMVLALVEAGVQIHCLRDLTRGGLVSALNEISQKARVEIKIRESAVSVLAEVRGTCEMLGLDVLSVANEGRLVAFVPESDVERALQVMKRFEVGEQSCEIGAVESGGRSRVLIEGLIGVTRVLDMPSGEQLPRIC